MEKPPRRNHFHTNNSGFTLVGVLMVLVVLSVLGLSILMITSNSVKLSAGERDDQSVFYIAEAGLTVEMDEIEGQIQSTYSNTNDANSFFNELFQKIIISGKYSSTSFEKTLGEITPKAKIDVVEQNSGNPTRLYKVTSTGIIDKKSRVVEREFSVTWVPKSSGFGGGRAAFVRESIIMEGSAKIIGSAGTLKSGSGTIDMAWSTEITGDIYAPAGSEDIALKHANSAKKRSALTVDDDSEWMLPNFPLVPTYRTLTGYSSSTTDLNGSGNTTMVLNGNASLGNLNVSGSHTLTINVGDTDKELVLDGLSISGSGKVILKGKGKLTLHIRSKFTVEGSGTLNAQSPTTQLNIYYKGLTTFDVGGSTLVYGSIYAESADVKVGGSNAVRGSIISGGRSFIVEGSGSVQPSLYYAPNANFQVAGSGKIYGVMIGKSLRISGAAVVEYQEPLLDGTITIPGFGNSGEVKIVKAAVKEK